MTSAAAQAQGGGGEPGKARVGALKLTSSAPLFVGVDKEFFREFGVEPELAFFLAAAPIATGQVEWWTSHGFMKRPLALEEVVDTSFIESAIKELGG